MNIHTIIDANSAAALAAALAFSYGGTCSNLNIQ
jgi:hypothetical protein